MNGQEEAAHNITLPFDLHGIFIRAGVNRWRPVKRKIKNDQRQTVEKENLGELGGK